jgi:glycoside/pentoside/hexuronide:cation symporter, GPH family
LIAYAAITNTMLMTLYSMNNMPYAALGGVMTGDVNERARLNSFRFIAVNAAQFIVGGFTLPLVAKFAVGHDRQHGWQMTMMIWAVLVPGAVSDHLRDHQRTHQAGEPGENPRRNRTLSAIC